MEKRGLMVERFAIMCRKITRSPISLFFIAFVIALSGTFLIQRHGSTLDGPRSLSEIEGMEPGEHLLSPTLSTLSDQRINLLDTRDNYVLCCFFSTTCPGCAEDAEPWRALVKRGRQNHVTTFIISVDDDPIRIERFIQAYDVGELPVLYDPDGQCAKNFKIHFVPQYLLFDNHGRLVKRWLGLTQVHSRSVDERVRSMLAAASDVPE
ncbi:MAG: TlpA family protein disulfide reductase [Acidobacteria bacterium]|nr:MAG: TlpA family protein disulfide reductase [Acidobacteriota bacterium]